MANGRLAKDVQYLCRHVEAQTQGQASVFEVDDNLEFLILHIMPTEGFYRGARIRFKVIFDGPYPDCTPVVNCCDKIYHPNIDSTEEDLTCTNICVSLLSDWTTSMDLDHVVMSILFLMYHPAFDDALSPLFDGCDIDEGNGEMEEDIRRSLRGEEVEGWTFDRLMIGDDDNDDANDDDENAADNAGAENAVANPEAENAVENVADNTGAENGGDNAGAEKAGDEVAATNECAGNAAGTTGAENAADNTGAENVVDITGAENAADSGGSENATDNTGVTADKDAVNEAMIKDNPETESNTVSTFTANTPTQSSTNTAVVVAEIVSQENAVAVASDTTSETPCSADRASELTDPQPNEDGACVAHSSDCHSSVSDSVASGIDGSTATFVPDMTCTDTETHTDTVINANPDTALETSPQTAISDLTSCNFLTSQITNIVVINALNSADMVRPCQLDDFCIAGLFAQSKRAGPKDRMSAFSDLWQNHTVAIQTDPSFRVGSPVDVTEVD